MQKCEVFFFNNSWIVQWGIATGNNMYDGVRFVLPTSFSTDCYMVCTSIVSSSTFHTGNPLVSGLYKTDSFVAGCYGGKTIIINYIAIGS